MFDDEDMALLKQLNESFRLDREVGPLYGPSQIEVWIAQHPYFGEGCTCGRELPTGRPAILVNGCQWHSVEVTTKHGQQWYG